MRQVAAGYMPDQPLLVLPDPFPEIDLGQVRSLLAHKLSRVQETKIIPVVWFGIGSNPYFSVGLSDLAAYSTALAELNRGPLSVDLTVLTDRSSLTANNLARLAKLPVPYRIELWSKEAEEQALLRSLVSFIPVNGQSFSRAKSLNRALSAISAGTQVLSPGYPLYRAIDTITYRSARELLADIESSICKIRIENVDDVNGIVSRVSNLAEIASELVAFLNNLVQKRQPPRLELHPSTQAQKRPNRDQSAGSKSFLLAHKIMRAVCAAVQGGARTSDNAEEVGNYAILHGIKFDKSFVALTKAAGILSVRSPLTKAALPADIYIRYLKGRKIEIWIRPELRSLVKSSYQELCSKPTLINKQNMIRIMVSEASSLQKTPAVLSKGDRLPVHETAAYRDFVHDMESACARIFPGLKVYLSDPSEYARSTLVPMGK
jgi:hypothetical protein